MLSYFKDKKIVLFICTFMQASFSAAYNTLIFHNKLPKDEITVVFFEKGLIKSTEIVRHNIAPQEKFTIPLAPEVTKVKVDVYYPAIKIYKGEIPIKNEKKSFSYTINFEKNKDSQRKEIGVDETSFKLGQDKTAASTVKPERVETKQEQAEQAQDETAALDLAQECVQRKTS